MDFGARGHQNTNFPLHRGPLQLISDSATDVGHRSRPHRVGSAVVLHRVDLSFGGLIILVDKVSGSETWRHPRWLVPNEGGCGEFTVEVGVWSPLAALVRLAFSLVTDVNSTHCRLLTLVVIARLSRDRHKKRHVSQAIRTNGLAPRLRIFLCFYFSSLRISSAMAHIVTTAWLRRQRR